MKEKKFIIAKVEIIRMDNQSIVTASGANGFGVVIDPDNGEIWNGGIENE